MEFSKKSFLEGYLIKQKELTKRQREYKKILSTKLKSRKETIMESSYQNTIDNLMMEKDTLRAQIWVASGATHEKINNRCLANIKCHVQCQEHLAEDIHKLKIAIANLERENSRVNKQVYDLNRKTVPDSQHQAYVARARKKMHILENQLEVGVRRECGFTASNANLREDLIKILNHRTYFNDAYGKLIEKLNSDKKYLVELIEYALATFDNCIDVYEKIENMIKKDSKESDIRKIEMQGVMRKLAADLDNTFFFDTKGKERKMDDLQPKEYRRREEFRKKHKKKITLYNNILDKILEYTQSENVESVIEKFKGQESLYYSYFNYANEMSYHMTLLNNSVNRLFSEIKNISHDNDNRSQNQVENIETLEHNLRKKRQHNAKLMEEGKQKNDNLIGWLDEIQNIFKMCKADPTYLMPLLGNTANVDIGNMRLFLTILEKRVIGIVSTVFVSERRGAKSSMEFCIAEIEKTSDYPTDIDDIVLTQQCPECAEGEAFNMDDGGDGVLIHSVDDIKKKLYEKVNQPEMQYRLHSISQCRLPRSRLLAAKRNI